MRIQIAGRQMDVGEALRTRIEEELEAGVVKYFSRVTDAMVTVAKNGVGHEVDVAVHLASGISLQAEGKGGDAHSAFSDALTKIEKRVRRYKRRLRNHHAENKSPLPAEAASAYVLAPFEDGEDLEDDASLAENEAEGDAPLIIAEGSAAVKTMSVATAVLQLDLVDAPVVLFRNAATGGLNVVYRRVDGNVGWIDPTRGEALGRA
jgi:ribosomal subunit interface protein